MRTGTGYSAAALFSVGFLAWMVYENIFLFAGNVERFIEAITSVVTVSKYQHYLVDFPTLGITGMKFVDLFLRMYGDNIIFLALTLIAIFLIYKRSRSGAELEAGHKLLAEWRRRSFERVAPVVSFWRRGFLQLLLGVVIGTQLFDWLYRHLHLWLDWEMWLH